MVEKNEMNRFFKLSQEVYASLADPLSKALFAVRMQYNLTNSYKSLFDMVELSPSFAGKDSGRKLLGERLQRINKQDGTRLIIYGAGWFGGALLELFDKVDWYAFCDKDSSKLGTTYFNLPVISPEELIVNHKSDHVVISSPFIYEEVYKELQRSGFPVDQIIFGDILAQFQSSSGFQCDTKNQYFEAPIMIPQPNEVFVDAGCCDCGTSLLFREWCGGNYDKIYAFEPDPECYDKCQSAINQEQLHNIELLNAGAWSCDDQLNFNSAGDGASSINSEGAISINVRSIDGVLKGERATLIKLDIEGAELQALKGARETIVKHRPRLAVCVYHKPEDLLEIQLYLQSLIPDYKFYIRHYSNFWCETVLYAV
ncbi:FkbM family methyltransferase [Cohnella sp. LGH]|uniref:FkbM family methyltransferase n=1 Tax=Cohnella sp. LGH TaxID=1619153 RepID=UPI001ADC5023|nr:FkbM family methyltransferase [Cohnella sp. LGH]QTH42268.1 FkbM family methyltransferase [Cohnella sp. LGH]